MNRIKELRMKNNLTLSELSKEVENKTGVPISADLLSKYERNERNITLTKGIALANFFNVSRSYMMNDKKMQLDPPKIDIEEMINGYQYEQKKDFLNKISNEYDKVGVIKANMFLDLMKLSEKMEDDEIQILLSFFRQQKRIGNKNTKAIINLMMQIKNKENNNK